MTARVGIVGAGPAGLLAARTLCRAGWSVTLFDKGRRPGGRMNTREHGAYRFDHGAQYFTVRDPRIQELLGEWISLGIVAEWPGRLVRISPEGSEPAKDARRFVGMPSMISLASHLAAGLDVQAGVRIEAVERSGREWRLVDDTGVDVGHFDRVIVAVPAKQAAALLMAAPKLRHAAERVRMAPCWAGMFVFEDRLPTDFDGAFLSEGPLSWIARDSSKPGRPNFESWVVHGTPEWTARHWDVHRNDIPDLMAVELEKVVGPLPGRSFQRAHRWGYALADVPARELLYEGALGIGAVGDWCVGGRVEGALLSGIEMAERIAAE
jgi:predicted NAD/FAD-dependent oxidoreductase